MAKEHKKMGAKGGGGGGGGTDDAAAPIHDVRFAKMQSDPRFLNVPTKKKKVVVDDRFKVCNAPLERRELLAGPCTRALLAYALAGCICC